MTRKKQEHTFDPFTFLEFSGNVNGSRIQDPVSNITGMSVSEAGKICNDDSCDDVHS